MKYFSYISFIWKNPIARFFYNKTEKPILSIMAWCGKHAGITVLILLVIGMGLRIGYRGMVDRPDRDEITYMKMIEAFAITDHAPPQVLQPSLIYVGGALYHWGVNIESGLRIFNLTCSLLWLFMMYFTIYRRLSVKCGKPCLWMIPDKLIILLFRYYHKYSQWRLQRGRACIALSGLNVFKDNRWYVPFDGINIHPPYNGEGDTVIFKIKSDTYWTRHFSDKISYSVTEKFNNPYKIMFTYPVWFHLHANREYCWGKVKKMKDEHPECFVPIECFPAMSYGEVYDKMDKKAHTLFQMTLFALVHKIGKSVLRKHIGMLDSLK